MIHNKVLKCKTRRNEGICETTRIQKSPTGSGVGQSWTIPDGCSEVVRKVLAAGEEALRVKLGALAVRFRTTPTMAMIRASYQGSEKTIALDYKFPGAEERIFCALGRKRKTELTGYALSGSRGRAAAG